MGLRDRIFRRGTAQDPSAPDPASGEPDAAGADAPANGSVPDDITILQPGGAVTAGDAEQPTVVERPGDPEPTVVAPAAPPEEAPEPPPDDAPAEPDEHPEPAPVEPAPQGDPLTGHPPTPPEPEPHPAEGEPTPQGDPVTGEPSESAPAEGVVGAAAADGARRPGFRERGRLRRRLRYLRSVRELGFRDLGGLVFDQHRFQRPNEELVQGKVEAIDGVDREVRAIEDALQARRPYSELFIPGVSACARCGALHASDARFCPHCGLAFGGPRSVAGVGSDGSAPGGTPAAGAPPGQAALFDPRAASAGAPPAPGTEAPPAAP